MRLNPVRAFISMGSNMGDKVENLVLATQAMNRIANTQVQRVSALYSTDPVGFLEQDEFVNAVAEITTYLEPEELLTALQEIEHSLGRVRIVHWGPRTIDLDIILYGEEQIQTTALTVPHPRAIERAFVLKPLLELSPGMQIAGQPLVEFLTQVSDQKITLYKQNWFDKLI